MSSWLSNHLENFVKPVLGYVPKLPSGYVRYFSTREMSIIKNMWRSVKRESVNKQILLAGRDVFIFEILAQREGFKRTTFRPDISRLTVEHVKENYRDHFVFDTGWNGSIPKALKVENYTMGSSTSLALKLQPLRTHNHQVFPRLKGARSLILKVENTPKYWRRGHMRGELFSDGLTTDWIIAQDLESQEQFLKAAYLTIEVYTDSSPKFVDDRNPLGSREREYLICKCSFCNPDKKGSW